MNFNEDVLNLLPELDFTRQLNLCTVVVIFNLPWGSFLVFGLEKHKKVH